MGREGAAAPAFLPLLAACVIDEDASHGLGGERKEGCAIEPGHFACGAGRRQLEIGFVDERGGAQGVIDPLGVECGLGESAKLAVKSCDPERPIRIGGCVLGAGGGELVGRAGHGRSIRGRGGVPGRDAEVRCAGAGKKTGGKGERGVRAARLRNVRSCEEKRRVTTESAEGAEGKTDLAKCARLPLSC